MADLEKRIDAVLAKKTRATATMVSEQSYWMTGGCLEYAKALKQTLGSGARLFDVVEPEPKGTRMMYTGFPHHVVVKHACLSG
jgi:hypothetical protein